MPSLEPLTLTLKGFQFAALAAGPTQGELVLCLHGFPQFADAWTPILHELGAAGYRAVAVDQRGYSPGARPAHVGAYSIDALVGDTLGFADALGARRFHLVGHDWGGIVAWTVGASYPDRLRSLTVLSTPHPDALRKALAHDFDQKRRSWYVALFRLPAPTAERILLAANGVALRIGYKGKVPPAQVRSTLRRLREPGALTAALNWYRALDLRHRTGPVAAPTLFVWSTHDQALGRRAAVDTAEYVSGPYQFEILDGASHWLLEERTETIVTLILAHMRRYAL